MLKACEGASFERDFDSQSRTISRDFLSILKLSGASNPMMMGCIKCFGRFQILERLKVPTAPSKFPASHIDSVHVTTTPKRVWIALSTWFNSLANTGLIKLCAVASAWLNATSMEISSLAKSKYHLDPERYNGSRKRGIQPSTHLQLTGFSEAH